MAGIGPGERVRASPLTREAALEPVLASLDRGADGRVDQRDWEVVGYGPLRFESADLDRDGALGLFELEMSMLSQDPLTFDSPPRRAAPDASLQQAWFAATWRERVVRDALLFMVEEVQSVDPDLDVPSHDWILGAASRGGLHSAFGRGSLSVLKPSYQQAG